MSRLERKISRITKKNKGSLKDPFLYFGAVSVILFLVLSLSPNFFWAEERPFKAVKNFNAFLASVSQQYQEIRAMEEPAVGPTILSLGESPEIVFIQKSSLTAISPPVLINPQVLGSLSAGSLEESETSPRTDIISYTVLSGDNFESIADRFNISLDTLLWANDLNRKSKIKAGQELIILPVSGVIHYVKKGQTLAEIAKTYQADKTETISFNELSEQGDIFIGDILIIPNGTLPPPPKRQAIVRKPEQRPLSSSYFIAPTNGKITQGLHWYNAVDFANSCGSPIVAAAGGEVLKVKYGWNLGAGNVLTVLHPNGVVTSYSHIQKSLVNPGDQVFQGQIIALIGGQPGTPGAGISTGCHVHFSVVGGVNPFGR